MADDGAINQVTQLSAEDETLQFLQRTSVTDLPVRLRSYEVCQMLHLTNWKPSTTVWADMLDDLRNNVAACGELYRLFFKALEE